MIKYFFSSLTRISDLAEVAFTVQPLSHSEWGTGDYVVGEVVGLFVGVGLALAVFSQLRDHVTPFIDGACLGFFYFLPATAITTSLQLNTRDEERASIMPLWFMVFGGTVPVGILIGGVLFEWIGPRWVLLIGAGWALLLGGGLVLLRRRRLV